MAISTVQGGASPSEYVDMDKAYNEANELPPELDAAAKKHYGECNVRAYISKLAMHREDFHNGKLYGKLQELKTERDKLNTITNCLLEVRAQLDNNPNTNTINLANQSELVQKLKQLIDTPLLEKTVWTRLEAERICLMLTRQSDGVVTPKIQELASFEIPQIIEDWNKLFPILKEILKAYDELINRINSKPK